MRNAAIVGPVVVALLCGCAADDQDDVLVEPYAELEQPTVLSFAGMMWAAGLSTSDYNGYGCWCGSGPATPAAGAVDATDECCRTHDECWDSAPECDCAALVIGGASYYEFDDRRDGVNWCAGQNAPGSCAERCCWCDFAAVQCFLRNRDTFIGGQLADLYWSDLADDPGPSCDWDFGRETPCEYGPLEHPELGCSEGVMVGRDFTYIKDPIFRGNMIAIPGSYYCLADNSARPSRAGNRSPDGYCHMPQACEAGAAQRVTAATVAWVGEGTAPQDASSEVPGEQGFARCADRIPPWKAAYVEEWAVPAPGLPPTR